jgi:hypothetical protein
MVSQAKSQSQDELGNKYLSEYRLFSMRCKLLQEEFRETASKLVQCLLNRFN